jgi:parallel beta-helix repeat protein
MHGLTAGKSYILRARVYNDSFDDLTFALSYSTNGSTVNDAYSFSIQQKDAWVYLYRSFNLPSSTTGINLYLRSSDIKSDGKICYIDDVSLVEYDPESDGCQITDCSITNCTHDGIYVETNSTQIKNNTVNGSGDRGIVIAAGCNNRVTANNANDNGDDVGIDNTNKDNYYDDGTGTIVNGNSWETYSNYAYNTQATINTNDTTSFATGEEGTAILANTAITYYYCRFADAIKPSDKLIIEVRSKLNSNAWIEAKDATGAAFEGLGIMVSVNAAGNVYGFGLNVIDTNTVKIITGKYAAIDAVGALASRTWANLIGYTDGFDRWRVRKSG